jgi:hypothetical protein
MSTNTNSDSNILDQIKLLESQSPELSDIDTILLRTIHAAYRINPVFRCALSAFYIMFRNAMIKGKIGEFIDEMTNMNKKLNINSINEEDVSNFIVNPLREFKL